MCLLAGLALLLSACGSDAKKAKTPPPPKNAPASTPPPAKRDPASKADVAVIKGWTDALREGHVKEASRFWGLPAIVSNGTPVYRLRKRSEIELWNRSLPCGATFKEAVDTGAYVVATLVLTERPGAGKVRDRRRQRGLHRVPHPPPQDRAVAAGREAGAARRRRPVRRASS